MKNIANNFLMALVLTLGVASEAYATKTEPQLPITASVSKPNIKRGEAFEYVMTVSNQSASSYWGVNNTMGFPSDVACTSISTALSKAAGNCQLGNFGAQQMANCNISDLHDWGSITVRAQCRVKETAVCGSRPQATASMSVDKPAQGVLNSSATFAVTCDANPLPNPNTPQCRDGIDNDGDGKIDALVESTGGGAAGVNGNFFGVPARNRNWMEFVTCSNPQGGTRTFGNGSAGLVNEVNQAIRTRGLPITQLTSLDGGPSISDDAGTASAICGIFGYSTLVSTSCRANDGRCNYTSPNNNNHWQFSGTVKLGSCNDGIDNDNDGLKDFPADPGCASPSDTSEAPHDPGCTNPEDNDERDVINQCEDGIDNDNDGRIDFPADAGCSSPTDNNEGDEAQCQDGKDNDGDGRTDFPADPGCSSPTDPNEGDEPQCQDNKDNDGDGKIDFPADPGCSSTTDTTEQDDPQCSDGRDNDNDGRTDFPADAGCSSPTDNNEGDEAQCQDGKDNDGDGRTDFPADPGCTSATDQNEGDEPQCQDNKDNDGDGKIDFPADPGCSSATDTTEQDDPQCSDGRDNDNDGRTDFPADAGCSSATDNNEGDEAQCQDGKDNDGDGRTDFPADPGCTSATDQNEGDEPQCQDNKDNDGDGKIDFPADPGCSSATDTTEQDDPQCSDGRDNDNDGRIDLADPGCDSPTDTNEGDEPQCKDGRDNDGDGKIDFPADPGCTDAHDNDENGESECNDGKDNDGDGWIDFPEDGGCSSKQDTSERDPNGPQCDNGLDDDSDGKIDFPHDPDCTGPKDTTEAPQCSDKKDNDNDGWIDLEDAGCSNAQDDDESNEPQCSDKRDNDSDGKIDLLDPGCKNPTDNDESDDPKSQCSDGKDNDSDGKIDFPADPGCTSATDDTEGDDPKTQCSDSIDNDSDGWIDFPEDSGCTSKEDNDESNAVNSITPTVTCLLDNGDGSSTAFFGYVNSSAQLVTVSAGSNTQQNINTLSSGIVASGQPSTFATGQHDAAFFATLVDTEQLTWTLMVNGSAKSSVTAKKGVSKACAPIVPLVECVDQTSTTEFSARFGYDNQNGFEVPMAIGKVNQFAPGSPDQGQPNKFFKGLVKTAFTVSFGGTDLIWTVGAKSVTASTTTKSCNPNTAPVCNAGGAYNAQCQGTETKIHLDGSASSDPEGKVLSYKWSTTCTAISIDSATAAKPIITLAGPGAGTAADCLMLLVVSDGILSSSCETPVQVPACSTDCQGTAGGSAQLDQCGVCGGDGTSCVGCDGVPNSGATADQCGVCGGSDSCLGCDGIANSGAVVDACGVCGGDGQSCIECTDTDIMQTLFAMDGNAQRQLANANSALRRLSRRATDKKTKEFVEQARTEAAKISNLNWQLTWSLPQVIKTCAESSGCAASDNSIMVDGYNTNSASLRDITQQALRELTRVLGGDLRVSDRKIGIGADRLHEQSLAISATVPRFQSVCQ